MELWRERALVFINDRSNFWNHFVQIMHIRRSVVRKISTLGNFIKVQNTLGFQPRVFQTFVKLPQGESFLITTPLMHYLYTIDESAVAEPKGAQ